MKLELHLSTLRKFCASHAAALVFAINEAPAIVLSAVNESIDGDEEWFRLAPPGEHPNEVGLQVLDAEAAREMVAAFNSPMGKLARLGRGLPIWVGHPTNKKWREANPEIYAKYPHPVGRIIGLEDRNGEVWYKPAFNDIGLPLVKGPAAPISAQSPEWGMRPIAGRPGALRPVLLDGIGLTNFPNIGGTQIGLNEETEQTTNQENTMPEWILKMLGLTAGANETQIKDALKKVGIDCAINEAAITAALTGAINETGTLRAKVTQMTSDHTAALTTATNEKKTAEEKYTTERQARAEAVVTNAINEGRIVEVDRKVWVDGLVAAADFSVEEKKLGTLKSGINTQSQVAGLGGRKNEGDAGTVNAINEAVSAKAKELGYDVSTSAGYDAAFAAAARANPDLFTDKKA